MIGIRIEYLDSGSRPFGPFLRRLRLQYRANQVPQREPCAGPPRRRLVGRAGEAVAYTVPTVHRRRSDVTSLLNPAHFRTSRDTSSCTTSCVRSDPSPCGSATGMRNGKFNTTQYDNLIQYALCGSTAAGPAMSIRLKTLPVDEQPVRPARRPDTVLRARIRRDNARVAGGVEARWSNGSIIIL